MQKFTVFITVLLSFILLSGTFFSIPTLSVSILSSSSTNNQFKFTSINNMVALAQEDHYYYDDYNNYDSYDKSSYEEKDIIMKDKKKYHYDNGYKTDEKKIQKTIDNKIITTNSDGNVICAIILDDIQNLNNSPINISDISMCNTTLAQEGPTTGGQLQITKQWFVCDNNENIDCTIEEEGQIQSFQGPDSGMYAQCTSQENNCSFVNDADFEILIGGTNPIPDTISALVNTMKDVQIGAGEFEVSELVSSDRLVPDANIDVIDVDLTASGGILPTAIVLDQQGQRVFTADTQSSSVSVIDLNNDNAVTNIGLSTSGGVGPEAITFDPQGQRVFTANFVSDSVSIIELTNNNAVTDVDLSAAGGNEPLAITFDPQGQRVFTANFESSSVSIIRLNAANFVTDVDLSSSGGLLPSEIIFDQQGQRLFTANLNSDSISIIDLNNGNAVTNVDLSNSGGSGPIALSFDQQGQRLFTANEFSNSVSIIELDNANAVTNIDLSASGGIEPRAITFDPQGQRLFTANAIFDNVSIIELDNANAVTNIGISSSGGNDPNSIVFDQQGQRLFTSNQASNSISMIELNNANAVTNLDLSSSGADLPVALVFDQQGQRLFTSNQFSSSVSIIDIPTVSKVCIDAGFDTGDIREYQSNGQTLQQITCVNLIGECSGNIQDGETKECTFQDYAIKVTEISDSIGQDNTQSEGVVGEEEFTSSSFIEQQQNQDHQQLQGQQYPQNILSFFENESNQLYKSLQKQNKYQLY